jgi:hypothetical protein
MTRPAEPRSAEWAATGRSTNGLRTGRPEVYEYRAPFNPVCTCACAQKTRLSDDDLRTGRGQFVHDIAVGARIRHDHVDLTDLGERAE